MSNMRYMSVVALFMLVLSCAASVSVKHDYDPQYDFAALKTYSWLSVQAPAQASELRVKRFQSAIDRQLETKGMQMVSENPDFMIALHGFTTTKVNVTDYGYNYGRYWSMGSRNIDVSTYKEGTIFLDFVDSKSKELVWRSSATSVVEPDLSVEEQEQKFNMAGEKMLAEFPPAAK